MYLLINNDDIVVDYSKTINYIKIIEKTGLYIFTKNVGMASLVKSNRTDKMYFLQTSLPQMKDCVYVVTSDVVTEDDIICGYSKYIIKNDIPTIENNIEQIQKDKQEENKTAFNNYLLAHPYEYNGKQYGTTLQDQLEINLMLSQAQAMAIGDEEPQVEWHATTEVNESMSVSDLLAIQAGIKNAVAAPYKKMQEYKKAIFDCTDAKTLVEMSFEYEGDENA